MIVTARKFEGKNRNNSGELKPVKEMDGKLAGVEVDVNSDEFTVLDLNTRTSKDIFVKCCTQKRIV